jgi:hypothetical protein
MCIYRYHNKNNLPLEFKDFEILDISYDNNPIEFIKIGNDLTDRDLLRVIIEYVKGKISMIGF